MAKKLPSAASGFPELGRALRGSSRYHEKLAPGTHLDPLEILLDLSITMLNIKNRVYF